MLPRQLLDHPTSAIQDRSVYEDAEVFKIYIARIDDERDWFIPGFVPGIGRLPPPDLVVYLRASVPKLLDRIKHRGRVYERQIGEYLNN
jgi:deoxyadenosine/deoxycytidine kinase